MKAVGLDRHGEMGARLRDFPDPVPASGESVMRVVAAGLNRVDLYVRDSGAGITQTLPLVMGVEGAGEIVAAEPGSRLRSGMKVVLYSEAYCNNCRYCLAADQPLCETGRISGEHRHRTFSEYIAM